jgi:two-component system sensor histidine kinase ChiS
MTPGKLRLARDFKIIAVAVVVVIFALSSWFTWKIITSQVERNTQRLESIAKRIERTLIDDFDYTSYQMEYLANQIKEKGTDSDLIYQLFRAFRSNNKINIALSWNMFSWVDKNFLLTVDGNEGILKYPVDLSKRDYLPNTVERPREIFFGEPVYGGVSKQLVIPAGMGVTDKNGSYLGSIVFGFDIGSLIYKLEQIVNIEGISFVIIDNTERIFVESSNNKLVTADIDLSSIIKTILIEDNQNARMISTASLIKRNRINMYYQPVAKYPFSVILSLDKNISYQELWDTWSSRIFEFHILGLILLALLFTLYRKVIRPIVILTEAAEKLSKGNNNVSIPEAFTYEISILGEQLLKVAKLIENERRAKEVIEEAHKHIKLANESLEKKILERTQELQQALSIKTEFLNNISHEIRTPIQGVTAISRGLVDHWQDFNDKQKFDYANQVAHNADRLFSLVNNILDLSKFNAGKMVLDLQPNDIILLIKDLIEECRPLLLDKPNLHVTLQESTKMLPLVVFDKSRIGQVIRNLLANAIKFTAEGKITIKVSEKKALISEDDEQDSIYISVEDQGIGIPESELDIIFQAFTQSSRTKTKAGGTGLGLSISAEIIRSHQGQIWAENNKNGHGITFFFTLPKTVSSITKGNDNLDKTSIKDLNARILVIDDEQTCLNSMGILLHDTKFELFFADGGQAGLEYLRQNYNEIDIILLDLMMPDMYGLNVLAEIKNNINLKHIPVILQTGVSDETEIAKAMSMGVIGYITKPYNKDKILSQLQQAL